MPLPRVADLVIGTAADLERQLFVPWRGQPGVLIAGASGGGKTTALIALLEQLRERKLQNRGDRSGGGIRQRVRSRQPRRSAGAAGLDHPGAASRRSRYKSAALDLLAVPFADRPDFLAELIAQVDEDRPHDRPAADWLVLDEAHHLVPACNGYDAGYALPRHSMGAPVRDG